jgi:hypothetical protein
MELDFWEKIKSNGGIFDEAGRKEANSMGSFRPQTPGGTIRAYGKQKAEVGF